MEINKSQKNQLKELAEKYHLAAVYLFGSRARKESEVGPLSDYDFAILFEKKHEKPKSFDLELKITDRIASIFKIKESIDLVVLNNVVNLVLKMNIIKTSQLIYQKDKSARIEFEVYTMKRYSDELYYSRRYNNHLFDQILNQPS